MDVSECLPGVLNHHRQISYEQPRFLKILYHDTCTYKIFLVLPLQS